VTLSQFPLFVKAGSLVPMWEAAKYNSTAEYNSSTPITLRYFPGEAANTGFIYDDDGNNPNALENENAHQLLSWSSKMEGTQLVLRITASNWPEGTSRELKLQLPPHTSLPFDIRLGAVIMNGKPTALQPSRQPQGWHELPFIFDGRSIEIVFKKQ
jgi:hypothetical protein